jgi:hypothetical protein
MHFDGQVPLLREVLAENELVDYAARGEDGPGVSARLTFNRPGGGWWRYSEDASEELEHLMKRLNPGEGSSLSESRG